MSYPFHTFHETLWASVYLQFLHNLAMVCLIFSHDCFPREEKYAICRVFNAKCPFNRSWTSLNWSLGGICFVSYLSLPISAGVWLLTWLISQSFPPGLSCYGWDLVCLNVSSCLEVTLTAPGKTWLCFPSKNVGEIIGSLGINTSLSVDVYWYMGIRQGAVAHVWIISLLP